MPSDRPTSRSGPSLPEPSNKEKSQAFEWLRSIALDENRSPAVQRLAYVALREWSELKSSVSETTASEEAMWELRKVVLAYAAMVKAALRSPARAAEMSVAIGSARALLEKHGKLHLQGGDLAELQSALRDGLDRRGERPAGSETTASTGPLKLDTDRQVFFYEQDHYYLSNFSAFRITFDGQTFDTAEAAYHYQRFTTAEHRRAVLYAYSAHEAFRYAQDHKADQRPEWDKVKVGVMRDILRAKSAQHEYVRRKLLQTGDRELVENSWRDPFWGWGPNRDGKNMLGRLWMVVRDELASRGERDGKA